MFKVEIKIKKESNVTILSSLRSSMGIVKLLKKTVYKIK